jgi:hypothetical protein
MKALPAAALLLALAACATAHDSPNSAASPAPKAGRQTDRLCFQDCVGNGGDRGFCEDRCTN